MCMKGFGLQSTDCDTAGKVGRRVFKLLRGAHGFWRIPLTWIGPSGPRLRFWPYQRSCGLVVKQKRVRVDRAYGRVLVSLRLRAPGQNPRETALSSSFRVRKTFGKTDFFWL